jgi:hypothetical protein
MLVGAAQSAPWLDCECINPVVDPNKWNITGAIDATYNQVYAVTNGSCDVEGFEIKESCYPANPMACTLSTYMTATVEDEMDCPLLGAVLDEMEFQCWGPDGAIGEGTANCRLFEDFPGKPNVVIAYVGYTITGPGGL